jgi:hypothetical protein
MDHDLIQGAMWWISIIEIPALIGLFTLIMGVMRELANFRIEVAKTYASSQQVRELEMRLTSHLLRIEAKLDRTALKAENLSARTQERKPS